MTRAARISKAYRAAQNGASYFKLALILKVKILRAIEIAEMEVVACHPQAKGAGRG